MTAQVSLQIEGPVATLVFDNVERHNAITLAMWEQFAGHLAQLEADAAIRVIVLKGAGEKAFVSGADLSEFPEGEAGNERRHSYDMVASGARQTLVNSSKPSVAMIQGFCLGGGLTLAMNADMRVASDSSQFGVPAAKLGLAYGADSVKRLLDLVGPGLAREILLTGRRLAADEALRAGLLNAVVPRADLEAKVADYARLIAENAPLSLKASKFAIEQLSGGQPDHAAIAELIAQCADSQDHIEGRKAFAEKRKPVFRGR